MPVEWNEQEESMRTDRSVDAQAQVLRLLLAIVGAGLCLVGWYRWAF